MFYNVFEQQNSVSETIWDPNNFPWTKVIFHKCNDFPRRFHEKTVCTLLVWNGRGWLDRQSNSRTISPIQKNAWTSKELVTPYMYCNFTSVLGKTIIRYLSLLKKSCVSLSERCYHQKETNLQNTLYSKLKSSWNPAHTKTTQNLIGEELGKTPGSKFSFEMMSMSSAIWIHKVWPAMTHSVAICGPRISSAITNWFSLLTRLTWLHDINK